MFRKNNFKKLWKIFSLIILYMTALSMLLINSVAAQGIVLDGDGSDWDPAWQVATDPLDTFLNTLGTHPHDAPTYARSGYDAIALWAHYQATDNRWYFRIDVDGRAGDSDSAIGTAGNPGVGTHGSDNGPLVELPFTDGDGLSSTEAYMLGFQFTQGASGQSATLGGNSIIMPGEVAPTTGALIGEGVYGTTIPGVIEFAFDRDTIFPPGTFIEQFWIRGQVGDNEDRVSDDQFEATMLMALDLAANCPSAPLVGGGQAIFPLNYDIPASVSFGASDVLLTADVPAGTSFVSASAGGTLSGSTVTWNLGDLAPGVTGQQLLTLRIDDSSLTNVVLNTEMSCAEGLRYPSSSICPLQASTATPPSVATPTPPSAATPSPTPDEPSEVPEPATLSLLLSGLGALGGYAALRQRRR